MIKIMSMIDGFYLQCEAATELVIRAESYFEDRFGKKWMNVPKDKSRLPVKFSGDLIIALGNGTSYRFQNIPFAYSRALHLIDQLRNHSEGDIVIVLDEDEDEIPLKFITKDGIRVEKEDFNRSFPYSHGAERPIRVRKGTGWVRVQLDPLRRVRR